MVPCLPHPKVSPMTRCAALPSLFLFLVLLCINTRPLQALGEASRVAFSAEAEALLLADQHTPLVLSTDQGEWPGVKRAAQDLITDFSRVLNRGQAMPASITQAPTIIVGTLGRNKLIDALAQDGRIDATAIRGKWEAHLTQVVDNPAPGISRALVIAGSDKRGTIYGIYELSEQIGVSPWYWWADVPVAPRAAIFAKAKPYVNAGPVVRYRGIFLNDEAPALTNWAQEKFGGKNSRFYAHVFELILRLRGNYLWPAMWNNAFNEDDPRNPLLADEYGVVMGTSHHEPMIRSQQEWKRHGSGHWNYDNNQEVLANFWTEGIRRNKDLESIVTLGMRGDGDEPMSEESNVALLQRIVQDQREILTRETGKALSEIPQVWALYKEVQEYYEKGMRVPDDVTLLWCDDNWGNIRRLPTAAERARSGGAGVYYHFDYVGDPRNYKWINTTQISKVWEQMHLAWKHEANRIWIVNVGDLKPMELPIDFFLNYAWNPAEWPISRLPDYTRLWAEREFGAELAPAIADIVDRTTRLNARIKPELLTPHTYSLTQHREAERVLAEWTQLKLDCERVEPGVPTAARDAFFQLVEHPLKAAAIVNELLITAGQNRLYSAQGRKTTNALAQKARTLFAEDAAMTERYHTLNQGKWNHMMDQNHLGYTEWQQPPRNAMPAVSELQLPERAELGVAVEGSPIAWPENFSTPRLPALESWNRQARYLEVFARALKPAKFSISTSAPWLKVSQTKGETDGDVRIWVNADWDKVPTGNTEASLTVSGEGMPNIRVSVPVRNPAYPRFGDKTAGFMENAGSIAIEAAHYTRAITAEGRSWMTIPGYGRTCSAVSALPVEGSSVTPDKDTPRLEYTVCVQNAGTYTLECQFSPTFAFLPQRGLRYAVSVDDQEPVIVDLAENFPIEAWRKAVTESTRRSYTKLNFTTTGTHTLKFWLVDTGVVLQRLILRAPAVRDFSFFGPPEL